MFSPTYPDIKQPDRLSESPESSGKETDRLGKLP